MKKNNKTRKRFTSISSEVNESHINPESKIIELDLNFNLGKNEIKAYTSHDKKLIKPHKLVHGYFGENKTRILSEIPTNENNFSLNYIENLKNYDNIIAIDTNSLKIKENTIYVGIAGQLAINITENSLTCDFKQIPQVFLIVEEVTKSENLNWKNLINFLTKHKNYNSNQKFGIIVDSDLGELDNFNQRKKAIIDDFYLPENFILIYASDKASDNLLNLAIKECHKRSNIYLNAFKEEIEEINIANR
ncbi:hypothetical protein QVZ41_14185 [Wenyingzhuangia sp. chi5]|uniref:Uncharacterized protein n=1 Tax=Wenyingzhuangia gilva TaxID=3057677 RepID=A0ABT8VVK0_9FLAO|nr:hypothetical protein [Wenyingzhuangia sp. chi5]MDO3695997.1 hypothetical protein [Wenyingzhuangia sp. chi5]